MAFNDILEAVTSAHREKLSALRAQHETEVARMDASLADAEREAVEHFASECARKKKNMERQIVSHARMAGRLSILKAKKKQLDDVYAGVLKRLAAMPPKEAEDVLKKLIDACPEGGSLRPSSPHVALVTKLAGGRAVGTPVDSVGGFVYESAMRERDCTFESLVHNVVRPATELAVSNALFPSGKA